MTRAETRGLYSNFAVDGGIDPAVESIADEEVQ